MRHLDVIMSKYSYCSCERKHHLFNSMFHDSNIVSQFQMGKTKTKYSYNGILLDSTICSRYAWSWFFFNWDSRYARLKSHDEAWSYKKRKFNKIKAYTKSVLKESTVKRWLLILDFKPFTSQLKGKHCIGREFQRNCWHRHLITSRNGERKIMLSIIITSRPPSRIKKWNQLIHFRWRSTKIIYTYRKGLSWLHFDDEPRVKERLQVKDQQSCISVFVADLTIPSRNYVQQPRCDNSISCMAV